MFSYQEKSFKDEANKDYVTSQPAGMWISLVFQLIWTKAHIFPSFNLGLRSKP